MEHITIISEGGSQVRLTADKGYQLRSRRSGNTYTTIATNHPKWFEAVAVEQEKPARKKKTNSK